MVVRPNLSEQLLQTASGGIIEPAVADYFAAHDDRRNLARVGNALGDRKGENSQEDVWGWAGRGAHALSFR